MPQPPRLASAVCGTWSQTEGALEEAELLVWGAESRPVWMRPLLRGGQGKKASAQPCCSRGVGDQLQKKTKKNGQKLSYQHCCWADRGCVCLCVGPGFFSAQQNTSTLFFCVNFNWRSLILECSCAKLLSIPVVIRWRWRVLIINMGEIQKKKSNMLTALVGREVRSAAAPNWKYQICLLRALRVSRILCFLFETAIASFGKNSKMLWCLLSIKFGEEEGSASQGTLLSAVVMWPAPQPRGEAGQAGTPEEFCSKMLTKAQDWLLQCS